MDNNLKFSVVVPVYNVEKYLDRCVNSIINQSYTNWELILVDDGSPDNCPKMCDEYASNDDRIKVVHQQNKGVSSSRNAGMNIATGDLLILVDSDDWLELDAFSKIIDAWSDDMDMCVFDYYEASTNTNKARKKCFDKEVIDFGKENNYTISDFEHSVSMIGFKGVTSGMTGVANFNVYNLKRLNEYNIRFAEKTFNVEDRFFVLKCIINFNTICYRSIPIYNYYWNQGSLSTKSYSGELDKMIDNFDRLGNYITGMNFANDNQKNLYVTHANIIVTKVMLWHLGGFRGEEKRKARAFCYGKAKMIKQSKIRDYGFVDKVLITLTSLNQFWFVETVVNSRRFIKKILKKR